MAYFSIQNTSNLIILSRNMINLPIFKFSSFSLPGFKESEWYPLWLPLNPISSTLLSSTCRKALKNLIHYINNHQKKEPIANESIEYARERKERKLTYRLVYGSTEWNRTLVSSIRCVFKIKSNQNIIKPNEIEYRSN